MPSVVRVCGRRGLVSWCARCGDWRAIKLVARGSLVPTGQQSGECLTCATPFAEVRPYRDDADRPAPEKPRWWLYSEDDETGTVQEADSAQEALGQALAGGWSPAREVFACELGELVSLGRVDREDAS